MQTIEAALYVSFLLAVLFVLLIMVTSAPAAAGTAGQAKVDRLVMGLITPYLDYTRPWINGTADHNIQHDPMLEWLVEVDPETGQYKPWLAESWQAGPGWTVVDHETAKGRAVSSRLWRVHRRRT